jgi:hypothetical protein
MIVIPNMPIAGFGNKVLYYNNMRQLAAKHNLGYRSPPWEGDNIFEISNQVNEDTNWKILQHCLGEKFFSDHYMSTREIFKLKIKMELPGKSLAIHFRGKDFHEWNPDSILDPDYYINAIEECGEVDTYYLFTDDLDLPSYLNVVKYLPEEKIKYGSPNSVFDDFITMCYCDGIISSPSTFAICAGFIGKHKKIIHSEKWINSRVEVDDKFWVDLKNGGNEDYSLWRLI